MVGSPECHFLVVQDYDRLRLKVGHTGVSGDGWDEAIRSAYFAADFGDGSGVSRAADEGVCVGGWCSHSRYDGGKDQRRGRGRDQRLQGHSIRRGHGEDAVHGPGGSCAVEGREGLYELYYDGSADYGRTDDARCGYRWKGLPQVMVLPCGHPPAGVPGAPRDQGVQSEECLHLNVFTPGLRDGKKRPVLVYFHGGAYNNGTVNSDLYDGKRLCHRGDVVVVTVNHRLNAFGYLYLGDLAAEYKDSGNAGQLDLVLALKWVKENIAEFGGDPTRVLIFGQSGGGAKCAALMATPVAKGLFHRVMTMSGQQIKGASIEIASGRAKTVLEKMGVPATLRGKDLVAKLNSLTMEQIQEGTRAVSSDWLPVVDNVILFRNPFESGCAGAVRAGADDAGKCA